MKAQDELKKVIKKAESDLIWTRYFLGKESEAKQAEYIRGLKKAQEIFSKY